MRNKVLHTIWTLKKKITCEMTKYKLQITTTLPIGSHFIHAVAKSLRLCKENKLKEAKHKKRKKLVTAKQVFISLSPIANRQPWKNFKMPPISLSKLPLGMFGVCCEENQNVASENERSFFIPFIKFWNLISH